MSIEKSVKSDAKCIAPDCNQTKLVIIPKEKDLGGFSVRRLLPSAKKRMVGPWLFFDHMGPAEFKAGDGINVRPHPHINLATVTYLFEGEILHRDSLGSHQVIQPGDVNLMVAGSGIVHSERERAEVTATDHRLHGLQLWLALPEKAQETAPEFIHYPDAAIPKVMIDDVSVKVIMGEAFGHESPVKLFAETLYFEATLSAGQTLTLPHAEERALYIAGGAVNLGDTSLEQYQMAILGDHKSITISATTNSRIALIGGEKMQERLMYWNFASTSKERIEEAKRDWREQRFDKVPGDDVEYIPLPE